jgi:hypothetical protein
VAQHPEDVRFLGYSGLVVLKASLSESDPKRKSPSSPNERRTHSPLMFADLMMGPATRPAPSGTWWCDRNAVVALIARVAREHKLSVVQAARRSHLPIADHQTRRRPPWARGKRSHW